MHILLIDDSSSTRSLLRTLINSGQTVSTASGKITCSNCTVNGYEFGTPGVPTPIFYGVMGFIFGIIAACVYNLIAKFTGGLKFEVRDAN